MLDWFITKDLDTWFPTRAKQERVDLTISLHINPSRAERRWEVLDLVKWNAIHYLLTEHHFVLMIVSCVALTIQKGMSALSVAVSCQLT